MSGGVLASTAQESDLTHLSTVISGDTVWMGKLVGLVSIVSKI